MNITNLKVLFCLFIGLTSTSFSQDTPSNLEEETNTVPVKPDNTEPNILKLYFNTGLNISHGLHDPQEILTEEQSKTILDLTTAHSNNSKIPITIFLFKEDQQIPLSESKINSRIDRIFEDKNQLLVFYYFGDVLKSKGHLLINHDDKSSINTWEVDEMFLKSARDASIPIDHFDQLQRYVEELSKRSYWIESKLIQTSQPAESPTTTEPSNLPSTQPSGQLLNLLSEYLLSVLAGLIVVGSGIWYYLWNRKWRKYVLPLKNIPQRLGAEVGATVSAPIEFSDVKVSLSDQRGKARNKSLEDI